MTDLSKFKPSRVSLNGRLPLICLPYAGGGSSLFYQWKVALTEVAEVTPVKLPGREAKIRDPAFRRMEPLVRWLLEDPAYDWSQPYALLGHSMGGLIAFEVAYRAAALGNPPQLLIMSSCRPHQPSPASSRLPLHQLPDEDMIDALVRSYGEGPVSDDERALMRILAPTLRADLELVHDYRPSPEAKVPCPTLLLGGAQDPQISLVDLQAWTPYLAGPVSLRLFPGGHFYFRNQQQSLMELLQHRLHQVSRQQG